MGEDESSVRVAVRIRPQIPREVIDMCRVCTTVTPGEPQVMLGSDKAFTYDYVFDMHETQSNIYERCVESLVAGSLQGYNATVLAYGQTGSGKTYTMGTGFDLDINEDQIGIIPRAIDHLFRGIAQITEEAINAGDPPPRFTVVAQFLELYNEEVIDLFDNTRDYALSKCKSGIRIHEDSKHSIYVTGVTSKVIHSAEDALQCLKQGALSRTTASTQMNSQSSRSHAIFTLHIEQKRLVKIEDEEADSNSESMTSSVTSTGNKEFETLSAKFHFVDLAGSERLKRTGATGERAKEGISINCGLLALGNVISALGDKSKRALHVPYRDSKLTRLLQDSLGGNSQTVMIACVSPSDRDFMETLNTLKYANRARNIQNKVMINQDKSSRTIQLLRQEIQQLQLELLEYKQGKRVVSEDGTEAINDMFHENTMLQTELNNLRTRVKAMQETIDTLSAKNSELLAGKAMGKWLNSGAGGSDSEMTGMIQGYLKEIEELRAKLLESEFLCAQLRKNFSRSPAPKSFHNPLSHSNSFILNPVNDTSSVGNLIAEAKKGLQKDLEALARSRCDSDNSSTKKYEVGEESENSEENEEATESDDDSGDKQSNDGSEFSQELADLTTDINLKQKLIEELEKSQKRLQSLKQHYEEKLMALQAKIKATQDERDKVLASFSNQNNNQPSEKVRKVRDEYESKLNNMQRELRTLQSAKKEHAKLLRSQSQYENQIKTLRLEVADMKRNKVKLINKMKEENTRHKDMEMRRNREIAQLRKESRKAENMIRSLEAEKRVKDVVLKRKQEEVTALRKQARGGLSTKAAGRILTSKIVNGNTTTVSPKIAKHKWQSLEKNITTNTLNKQSVVALERDMERLMAERKELHQDKESKIKQLNEVKRQNPRDPSIPDIEEEIETLQLNLDYIHDSIKEVQRNIIEVEDSKVVLDSTDLVSGIQDLSEASYLIEKLYNSTLHHSCLAAQKEAAVKELEARLKEIEKDNELQQQLLKHMLDRDDAVMVASVTSNGSHQPGLRDSCNSSAASSRSPSPTQDNGNLKPLSVTAPTSPASGKHRRRSAYQEDLLFGKQPPPVELLGDADNGLSGPDILMAPPHKASIMRVPSVPASNKNLYTKPDLLKPSPVLSRRNFEPPSSPRLRRNTFVINSSTNLLGKSGSMDQGLDKSPPNSPPTYRRLTSREENVFSRLTSGTTVSNDQHRGKGVIQVYQGRASVRSPLICTHVATGHARAVLALDASEDLLFSASRDKTVKVWDLHEGKEVQCLYGRDIVVAVKYNEATQTILSASSAQVRIWDLRSPSCIKTLWSSGLVSNGHMNTAQMPTGETQVNDIAINSSGKILYTAAGDKVKMWDMRRYATIGKLVGGHTAAVMCLAVDEFTPGEDRVITGSKDHYVKVFEVAHQTGGSCAPRINFEPPHYDGVQSLVVRDNICFSGSRDSCIKKWDIDQEVQIHSVRNAHKDWVCGLAYVPNQPLLMSVCRSGSLKLWSSDTCSLLGEMKAHESSINAIATNSSLVFTAANDTTIGIWRLNNRREMLNDLT
ncbi:kinesin-like protein KIF21A isoform X3 [Bemisia tabaci]|uniref:kinesin-like protein KIF21A isoform X3 n=1 Tax=Bemisia tabaci TaxID=7038 RepID=UPI003B282604